MFNFLVSGLTDPWARGFYEWDRGRILEYTEKGISSALDRLTEPELVQMASYPCLFACEGDTAPMRVGRITNYKIRPSTILIEFLLDAAVGDIPYEKIAKIFPLLDVRRWEMSRTHWAVKDANLFSRLTHSGVISESSVAANLKDTGTKPEGPAKPAHEVNSLQDYVAHILRDGGANGGEVYYRGHSKQGKYKLEPSLFRKDERGNYIYLDKEHLIYRELLISNSADFPNDLSTLDKLVRMQHFSLPTRLLDITSNPLIALYFACRSNDAELGEVISFRIEQSLIKYFDSDTASCIANLARLPHGEIIEFPKPETIGDNTSIAHFNAQRAISGLVHFIREEKPFFEPVVVPEDLKRVICVKSKKTNDRISSQSGAFLLFGRDAVLNEGGDTDIRIERVTVSNKPRILRELDVMNINESTVFPYIENSARYISKKYAFKD